MSEGMLAPYRVLDLSDERGFLCGRILADLGADVIKLEPPGGDSARSIGPFYGDDPDPEKSLYWFAYNANKRGVTIDLESAAGKAQFAALVGTADMVVESFAPGRMEALGFGYEAIRRINPGCILVSISPFGQTGPYRDFKGPDIVAWALSGHMSICGPPGGPPQHVSHHSQAQMMGGADAAVGAMIALHQRERRGGGQHVDVAYRDSMVGSTYQITSSWDMERVNRALGQRAASINFPWNWPCKDGYVVTVLWSGDQGRRRTGPLIDWMAAEGHRDDLVSAIDWDTLLPESTTREMYEAVVGLVGRFFAGRTKAELYEQGMDRNLSIIPVQDSADLAKSPQLAARAFWQPLAHDELGTTLTYPGPWAQGTEAPPSLRHRAPRIGEHNEAILTGLAGRPAPVAVSGEAPVLRPDPKPLAGLKILDFGWFMVGPVTTNFLADYGAEIIKIESTTHPDSVRLVGPHKDGVFGIDRGGDHAQHRTSERGMTLNLGTAEGQSIARRLVGWADVVFDNFAAGAMERMGFGDDALRAINPELVVLSCCGQGQTGPHRSVKGGGAHFVALCGLQQISGPRDGEPTGVSVLTDFIAPRFNAVLLLAALDHRRRTGRGSYFDVSQLEAAVTFTAPLMLDYFANGRVATRLGNRHVAAAPHGVYPCRGERWCAIAVFREAEWQALVEVVGAAPWTQEPRFATLAGRKQHEDDLDTHIGAWTRLREPGEVMRLLQEAGVAAGEVSRGAELQEGDPQLAHRGFWQTLDHPEIGPYRAPAHAFRLSGAPCEMTRAYLLGEHTAEVLHEVLGIDDAEIARLTVDGVLD